MHDPFLKSVFADRRMIEILIRDHAPEWADEIDSSSGRNQVSDVLEGLPGPEGIDRVTDALFACGTGREFIERVRAA